MSSMDLTRERLLEAAGQSFAENGFEGSTVRAICKRARVNLAAVNYYFRDKQQLYIETVKRAHQYRAQDIPLPEWPTGTPPERRLRDFVTMLMARMLREPGPEWHARLLLREMLRPTAACMEMVREFVRPHFDVLMEILDELLPPSVPASKKHLFAFSVAGQCLHYRVAQPFIALLVSREEMAAHNAETIAEHITAFTLAGLRSIEERPAPRKADCPATDSGERCAEVSA